MSIQIDYEALASNAKSAARLVVTLFERAGLPIVDVSSDGKSKRMAGIGYREVVFTFEDSQKLTLRVKATGDVYEARINNKPVPVAAQDDAPRAVAELVNLLDRVRAQFQRRLAALQMRPPEGIKTAAPKLLDTLKSQLAQVEEQIVSATEELSALQA
jgi:hypothetical protein